MTTRAFFWLAVYVTVDTCRFVAERSSDLDLAVRYDLLDDVPSVRRTLFQASNDRDIARDEMQRNFCAVLKSEMFGREANDLPSETRGAAVASSAAAASASASAAATATAIAALNMGSSGSLTSSSAAGVGESNNMLPMDVPASPPRSGLFVYHSPKKTRLMGHVDSPDRAVYNSSPLKMESQQLLLSPKKAPRQIPKLPIKVLDAPELQDDFYLNLVDWSAQNVLCVGLKDSVYLWSANTSKVVKLCELESGLGPVTSVGWMQRV